MEPLPLLRPGSHAPPIHAPRADRCRGEAARGPGGRLPDSSEKLTPLRVGSDLFAHFILKAGTFPPLPVAAREFCPCKLVTAKAGTTCARSSSGPRCSSAGAGNPQQCPALPARAAPGKGCSRGSRPLPSHTCKGTSLQSPGLTARAGVAAPLSRAL